VVSIVSGHRTIGGRVLPSILAGRASAWSCRRVRARIGTGIAEVVIETVFVVAELHGPGGVLGLQLGVVVVAGDRVVLQGGHPAIDPLDGRWVVERDGDLLDPPETPVPEALGSYALIDGLQILQDHAEVRLVEGFAVTMPADRPYPDILDATPHEAGDLITPDVPGFDADGLGIEAQALLDGQVPVERRYVTG
jgi:hypothetical protein